MRTLEEIFQHYFGCKDAFDEHGEFTDEGIAAYNKLTDLIEDVCVLTEQDVSTEMIQTLDEISDEKY